MNGVQSAVEQHEPARFSIPILLVAPRQDDRERLQFLLGETAWDVVPSSWEDALVNYRRSSNPIVVCDIDMGCRPWRETMRQLRAARPDACVIFIAEECANGFREEVMHGGAFDLLTRPFTREDLLLTLLFAYSHCRAHWPKNSPRRAFQPVVCASVRLREKER